MAEIDELHDKARHESRHGQYDQKGRLREQSHVKNEESLPVNASRLGAEAVLLSREARRDGLLECRGILALLETLSSFE